MLKLKQEVSSFYMSKRNVKMQDFFYRQNSFSPLSQ